MHDCHIFVNLFLFSIVIVQYRFYVGEAHMLGTYIGIIYLGIIYMCIEIQNMCIHIQLVSRHPNLNLFTVFKPY